MSNTLALPGYAGFGQTPSRASDTIVERSVLTTPERREPQAVGYAPRRGADLTQPVPPVPATAPVAYLPPIGPREANFYHLQVRGSLVLGVRRARERASNPPVPPYLVSPGY